MLCPFLLSLKLSTMFPPQNIISSCTPHVTHTHSPSPFPLPSLFPVYLSIPSLPPPLFPPPLSLLSPLPSPSLPPSLPPLSPSLPAPPSLCQFVDSPEVEKEVRRLLREDCNAINVCIPPTLHLPPLHSSPLSPYSSPSPSPLTTLPSPLTPHHSSLPTLTPHPSPLTPLHPSLLTKFTLYIT